MRRREKLAVICAAACACVGSRASAQVRAFPEAVGFGQFATGGRAGSIYRVTNLNDGGVGSFRDAVSQPNRTVVFDVGGYINLTSELHVSSNTTILGQTAPGQGIGLTGAEISLGSSSNIIMRYLRVRPGSASPTTANGINMHQSSNIILDHVSVEFAKWNNIDAVNATNITVQNSLIADPIGQQFGAHTEGGGLFTWHSNLWANAHNRQPLAKANTQFINNIVYNYQASYTSANTAGFNSHDVVNNYFITGPATTSAGNSWYQLTTRDSMYAPANFRDSDRDGFLDGSLSAPSGVTVLTSPWAQTTPYVPALSAAQAYAWVTSNAGASKSRDSVDTVIVNEVKSLGLQGPYPLPASQSITGLSNGGFGSLTGGALPTDTDGDFLPDTWEVSRGLNPNSPTTTADPVLIDPLGYTYLEKYANDLADTFPPTTWSASTGAWTTSPGNWSDGVPIAWNKVLIRGNGANNGVVANAFGTASAQHLSIGGNGPASGEVVNVNSGTMNVYGITTVGDQNNGKLQIASGMVMAPVIVIGNTTHGAGGSTTFNGVLEMTGGTLRTTRIVLGGGTPGNWTTGGSMSLGGGSIQAIGNLSINVPIELTGVGPVIDTSSFTGVISNPMSGGGGFIKRGTGSLTLSAANNYTGGTTIDAGALIAAKLPGGPITINGGLLKMTAKGIANDPTAMTTSAALSIDSVDSTLDLTNNSFLLNSAAESSSDDIRQWLLTGMQTGRGIISSLASSTMRLGYRDDGTSILIQFALAGDANLDGAVDHLDQAAFLANWNANAMWAGGDFDYNGWVDQSDFNLLKINFPGAVPEPGACLSIMGSLSAIARRRRKRD